MGGHILWQIANQLSKHFAEIVGSIFPAAWCRKEHVSCRLNVLQDFDCAMGQRPDRSASFCIPKSRSPAAEIYIRPAKGQGFAASPSADDQEFRCGRNARPPF